MARVKRGVYRHARAQKVSRQAKGFLGTPQEHHPRPPRLTVDKADITAYRDRKVRTARFPPVCQRINDRRREKGITYSRFPRPRLAGHRIDRKVLADPRVERPASFRHRRQVRAALV